jgi:hypothetical protein
MAAAFSSLRGVAFGVAPVDGDPLGVISLPLSFNLNNKRHVSSTVAVTNCRHNGYGNIAVKDRRRRSQLT